jgi:hypothetical protein
LFFYYIGPLIDTFKTKCIYRVRRKTDYTLKNGCNSLIRGRRRLYIDSYESLGYDTYNRASQIVVRTLEREYTLTYFLCLEIGCAHLKILQSRFAAYKRHDINLNSTPIDWKSLFCEYGSRFGRFKPSRLIINSILENIFFREIFFPL